jgi:NAD(P)-dependent dehydrogenase (short-subunit alcohol dehydrogenase family)
VVFVSSVAHAFGPGIAFDAIEHPNPETYSNSGAYYEAKSANILTALELSRRSKGAINAYSLHPGSEFNSWGLLRAQK